MIKITVELYPFGSEKHKREIGSIIIKNTGDNENSPEYGNYDCSLYKEGRKYTTRIKDFQRDLGWVNLLKKVIDDIVIKIKSRERINNEK
jgi:hypothetical protein